MDQKSNNFILTDSDKNLAENVIMIITNADPIGGFPDGGDRIRFQFPPTIESDGKSMNWMETQAAFTYEPTFIWSGAKNREITLKATYIVGGPSTGGIEWTPSRVAVEVRRWKSYFYSSGAVARRLPFIKLKAYNISPGDNDDPMHWRGISVDIKQSSAMIHEENDYQDAFPLRTDISLKLASLTNLGTKDGITFYDFASLKEKPPQEWY